MQEAWTSVTSEPFNPKLLSELAKLVVILAIDPEGADRQLAETVLGAVLPDQADPSVVLNILETISGDLMARRGGADQQVLRRAIGWPGGQGAGMVLRSYQANDASLGLRSGERAQIAAEPIGMRATEKMLQPRMRALPNRNRAGQQCPTGGRQPQPSATPVYKVSRNLD